METLPIGQAEGGPINFGTRAERLALQTSDLRTMYRFYETDTAMTWRWDGSAWRAGWAAPVVTMNDATDVPRLSVPPTVATVETPEIDVTGTDIFGARYTVNADDDVTAVTRLVSGAHCGWLVPGDSAIIKSDTAITRVDVVAVAGTAGTKSCDETANFAAVDAKYTEFNFVEADDVRTAVLTLVSFASDGQAIYHLNGFKQ